MVRFRVERKSSASEIEVKGEVLPFSTRSFVKVSSERRIRSEALLGRSPELSQNLERVARERMSRRVENTWVGGDGLVNVFIGREGG